MRPDTTEKGTGRNDGIEWQEPQAGDRNQARTPFGGLVPAISRVGVRASPTSRQLEVPSALEQEERAVRDLC